MLTSFKNLHNAKFKHKFVICDAREMSQNLGIYLRLDSLLVAAPSPDGETEARERLRKPDTNRYSKKRQGILISIYM